MERVHGARAGWFLLIHGWCVSTAAAPSRISSKGDIKESYRIVKPMRYESAFTSRWLRQRRSEPRSGVRSRKRPRPRRRAGSRSTARPCVRSRPVAARVPPRLLAGSRLSVRRKRTAPHAPKDHAGFGRCCRDSRRRRPGSLPQAGLENVKCEPGSTFTSLRHRWSNRRNFPGRLKQQP
jgi:hypothetical protein